MIGINMCLITIIQQHFTRIFTAHLILLQTVEIFTKYNEFKINITNNANFISSDFYTNAGFINIWVTSKF